MGKPGCDSGCAHAAQGCSLVPPQPLPATAQVALEPGQGEFSKKTGKLGRSEITI